MKLLYVTSQSGRRINGFMRSAIIAAKQLDIDFTIASNMDKADKELYIEDCETYGIKAKHIDFDRNPLAMKNYTHAKKQLLDFMRQEKFDVVHCNTPIGGVIGRICAKEAKIPYVIYQAHGFHFWDGAPLKNWICYYSVERYLAHLTDMLITINNEDYNRAKKFTLKNNGVVVKVPGVGVDLSKFDMSLRDLKEKQTIRMSLRKLWEIHINAIIYISVGELNENKNHEVAIRALAKTKNKDFYYVVCGEGNKKEYLIDLAEKLGVRDRVRFLGYQSNIAEILLACDCFLFTSFREGLPGSLMEAMASGLPCIASKIRGCIDLLEESKYLFNPNNPNELSDMMISIMKKEESRREIEKNSKRVVSFNLNNAVESLKKLYECVERRV